MSLLCSIVGFLDVGPVRAAAPVVTEPNYMIREGATQPIIELTGTGLANASVKLTGTKTYFDDIVTVPGGFCCGDRVDISSLITENTETSLKVDLSMSAVKGCNTAGSCQFDLIVQTAGGEDTVKIHRVKQEWSPTWQLEAGSWGFTRRSVNLYLGGSSNDPKYQYNLADVTAFAKPDLATNNDTWTDCAADQGCSDEINLSFDSSENRYVGEITSLTPNTGYYITITQTFRIAPGSLVTVHTFPKDFTQRLIDRQLVKLHYDQSNTPVTGTIGSTLTGFSGYVQVGPQNFVYGIDASSTSDCTIGGTTLEPTFTATRAGTCNVTIRVDEVDDYMSKEGNVTYLTFTEIPASPTAKVTSVALTASPCNTGNDVNFDPNFDSTAVQSFPCFNQTWSASFSFDITPQAVDGNLYLGRNLNHDCEWRKDGVAIAANNDYQNGLHKLSDTGVSLLDVGNYSWTIAFVGDSSWYGTGEYPYTTEPCELSAAATAAAGTQAIDKYEDANFRWIYRMVSFTGASDGSISVPAGASEHQLDWEFTAEDGVTNQDDLGGGALRIAALDSPQYPNTAGCSVDPAGLVASTAQGSCHVWARFDADPARRYSATYAIVELVWTGTSSETPATPTPSPPAAAPPTTAPPTTIPTTPTNPVLFSGVGPTLDPGTGEILEGDSWDEVSARSSEVGSELVRDDNEVVLQPVNDDGSPVVDDDFEIRLSGDCSGADCSIETITDPNGQSREVMHLQTVDGQARATGSGFQPGTEVKLWLFSEPTSLGTAIVAADGTFAVVVPLEGVMPGEHTLQANGVTADSKLRTAHVGVVLDPISIELPVTGSSSSLVMWALWSAVFGFLIVLARRRPDETTA